MTIPNLLSLARMGLIPLFILAVLEGNPARALLVFGVAGLSDALDGFIARFWNQRSALGAYLDPMADKLLLVSAYVVLAIPGVVKGTPVPVWVAALVITRDVVIVVVALVLYLANGISRFQPSVLSKVNTGVQVLTVLLVLLSGVSAEFEAPALVAVSLVAVFPLASGIDYIRLTHRMAGKR